MLPGLAGGARLLVLLIRLVKAGFCPRGGLYGRPVALGARGEAQRRAEAWAWRVDAGGEGLRPGVSGWRPAGAVCD